MAAYRAGVIGHTGRGGYGHGLGSVYLDLPEVELVALSDADAEGLAATGEKWRVPADHRYSDYREMLEKESLDLVSVAPRWVGNHKEMVLAAAESGVKGIYCEKPMARTLKDADIMLAACDKHGVKIAVAHQSRFNPLIEEMRRMVERGDIGEIAEIRAWGKQDSRGGGEDLMVLGTHTFDVMCLLFDPPLWVDAAVMQDGHLATSADAHEGNEEIGPIMGDFIHATYGFKGGILGTFVSRRNAGANRSYGFHLFGTKGVLAYQGGLLLHYPHPCWTPVPAPEKWTPVNVGTSPSPEALNGRVVRDLIAAIEANREPHAGGIAARWALEMILGVYAAHRNGRTMLPMANREHPLADWM